MSDSPPFNNDYSELMSRWFDELTPKLDAFKDSFTPDAEGFLKYLMGLHMMVFAVCEETGIPLEVFHDFATRVTAIWFGAGQPVHFQIKSAIVRDPPSGSKPN